MDYILTQLLEFRWLLFTTILVVLSFLIFKYLLNRQINGVKLSVIYRQIILGILGFLGIIFIFLSLPFPADLRNQIISLIGIVLSAAIALSSTTFLGNAFAGLMLKIMNHFSIGDFVSVNDVFGRVSKSDLLRTEIQTEDRDLITLPNIYLVTHPVKVIRDSGTVISATVSLGYDVHHQSVSEALIKAATITKLEDPFVHIVSLGDYSIVYRIHGMLKDVKKILTTKSLLKQNMLDELHKTNIEIVSPIFMNQRQVDDTTFIAANKTTNHVRTKKAPESIVFDKAEQAESIENKKEGLQELKEKITAAEATLKGLHGEDKMQRQVQVDQMKSLVKRMEESIQVAESEMDNEDQ